MSNRIKTMNVLLTTVVVSAVILFSMGCNGDDGVSSEFGSISGTITFENVALWPDSGVVQVTLWPDGIWTANGPIGAPQNPNDPPTLIKDGSKTQYTYKIEGIPEGTYSALAVGWRHPDETLPPEQRSPVLGVYVKNGVVSTGLIINFPGSPFVGPLPDTITIKKGENLTGLDIRADFANIQYWFPQN